MQQIISQLSGSMNAQIAQINNNLTGSVNLLKSNLQQVQSAMQSQIQNAISQMQSNYNTLHNVLQTQINQAINQLQATNQAMMNTLITPIVNSIKQLETSELQQELKAQISLEGLLNKLIATQTQLSTDIKNSLKSSSDAVVNQIKNTDYVSEEHIADWIKQALQPLKVDLGRVDIHSEKVDEQAFIPIIDDIGNAINSFVKRVNELFYILKKLERGEYQSIEQLKLDVFGDMNVATVAEGISLVMFAIPILKSIGEAVWAKHFAEIHFLATRKALAARPNIQDAFEMYKRTNFSLEEFYDNARDLGYSDDLIQKYFAISSRLPDVQSILDLNLRGEIPDDLLIQKLTEIGFTGQTADLISKLKFYQAPPQDVIRFMVRDVFDEKIAAQGRIFEGYDNPKYLELSKKVGVSKELASYYWASHWILPSINQGYEMLQREEIKPDELASLFKAADIAPGWRDHLLKISYNLPTRVDVRRAYEDGVIDDEKLKEYIRHSGVQPEYYDILFQWHKKRKIKIEQGKNKVAYLSISQILNAFKSGILNEPDTIQQLTKKGYYLEDIKILLDLQRQVVANDADIKYSDKFKQELRDTATEGYRGRTISHTDAFQLLKQSGLSDDLSNSVLTMIDQQYRIDRKTELIGAMRKLYIGYEISENDLFVMMQQNGFSKSEIDTHIDDLRPLRELRYRELSRADIRKGIEHEDLGIKWGVERLKGIGYSDTTIAEIMEIEKWIPQENSERTNGTTLPSASIMPLP